MLSITIIILIIVTIYGNVLVWRRHSMCCFLEDPITPGMDYDIQYSTHTQKCHVPSLPVNGSSNLLHPVFIGQQHKLLYDLLDICMQEDKEVWVSGGTLLGFVRHGTTMPWDDDCDMHTSVHNLEYMGSSSFQRALGRAGLERVKIIGTTMSYATNIGAALRVRRIGTYVPTCDIFFVTEHDGLVSKIDSWSGGVFSLNCRETWPKNEIFPIVKKKINGIEIPLPNDPVSVLNQQYGPTVMYEMVLRTTWLSHGYPLQYWSGALVTDDLN